MSVGTFFQSSEGRSLKETLDDIIDDGTDGVEAKVAIKKVFDIRTTEDAYSDFLEMGGPGFAAEVNEGEEIPVRNIYEGPVTRLIPRKYGMRIRATEEAIEDAKYDKVINAAKRNKRAMWKTVDLDGANVYNRMTNTDYPGGDTLPLGSASHTLPGGGTFSNLGTAISPSRVAYAVHRTAALLLPGHDGTTEGYDLKKVIFPVNQWAAWEGVFGSDKVPESNANEINVAHGKGIEMVGLKFWTASTTDYAWQTECEDGLVWLWRRKPRSRSWVENSQEAMNYSISARWDRMWLDARSHICVDN